MLQLKMTHVMLHGVLCAVRSNNQHVCTASTPSAPHKQQEESTAPQAWQARKTTIGLQLQTTDLNNGSASLAEVRLQLIQVHTVNCCACRVLHIMSQCKCSSHDLPTPLTQCTVQAQHSPPVS
jgi:hypothetical protein